ncbi:MAG: CoA transferase [Candidatus Binatia bacterium]|nr:CoA transferase [Candidatus Binatia bacterium]
MTQLPLTGVRVADFGWILAVPHGTAWLGVMGAEVIKIESAQRPDLIRLIGHPPGKPIDLDGSPYFNTLNFGKKSITLNLNHPKGVALAKELVRHCDVVTENFTVGNMKKWGLGYDDLCRIKPDLIMLSGTPLGQSGPESQCVGWGPHTQAYAGMCHLTGYPGGAPSGLGGTWPDFMIGVVMAFAIMSALHYRRRTGKGQYIDLAMAEVVMSMLPEAFADFNMNGRDRGRRGNRDDWMVPHNVYRCAGNDQWAAIAVNSEEEWRALCQTLGHPEWLTDPRFVDRQQRKANEEVLDTLIEAWTSQRSPLEVMHTLQAAGVAATPVYNTEGLCNDPQFQHRRYTLLIDHPVSGTVLAAGIPGLYSALPQEALQYTPAPRLGQHNDEIFGGLLGLSSAEIARLKEERVIC